jgi:nitrite reductase/ring-hydroxylating ferredoxin subunit/predicted secreted protein
VVSGQRTPTLPLVDAPLRQILPSGDLPAEKLHKVTVGGAPLMLARLPDGRVVAFSSNCPHQNTDLGRAEFVEGVVQCPLHGYCYDVETGENVYPAGEVEPDELWRLKPGYLSVHPVEERDGWIWVGPEPLPAPASYDPDLERPPAPAGPPPAPLPPGGIHPTKTLKVAPGTTIGLRLPTTPRPGFAWRVEAGGPYLSVVEERFESGEKPVHFIRIAARGEGRSTVTCIYARPWDTKPAETRTYEVIVGF